MAFKKRTDKKRTEANVVIKEISSCGESKNGKPRKSETNVDPDDDTSNVFLLPYGQGFLYLKI